MKTRYLIGVVVYLAMFSIPAWPQTQGTTLSLGAHWDDRSAVAGSVTIASVHVVGADTVLATVALTNGHASVTVPLVSNSIYDVTVASTTGAQLLKFPFTTALVNPQNILRGTMNLVLRKADSSLKSANVSVSMDF
jgi:hypothetical protein